MDEVHGSLFLQADRVVDLIYLKYLKADISYDGMIRVETWGRGIQKICEACEQHGVKEPEYIKCCFKSGNTRIIKKKKTNDVAHSQKR